MKIRQNAGIDYFRLAAALMVAAIHTAPFSSWNGTLDVLITYGLCRIAVPFFLMTTGYFVLAPYRDSGFLQRQGFERFMKKTAVLYLAATVLYLPVNWYARKLPGGFGEMVRDVAFDGTFYHLWYFPAVIMGSILLVLIVKKSTKAAVIFAATAYVLGMAGDSYYGLTEQVPWLKSAYEMLFSASSYTRNGIFFAPIFLLLGMMLAQTRFRLPKKYCGWGLVGSLALMTLEGYLSWHLNLQRHNSMYLFLLPASWFLFQLLLDLPGKAPGWIRNGSMLIYVIHPFVIVLLRGMGKVVKLLNVMLQNSMVFYLGVCIISVVISAGAGILWEKRRLLCIKREEPGLK